MQKILAGAIAVLVVGLGFVTWRWQANVERAAELEIQVDQLVQTVADQKADLKAEKERFDLLDQSLAKLGTDQAAIRKALGVTQAMISKLPRSEGDSDASFACLDTTLPAAARGILRDPAAR